MLGVLAPRLGAKRLDPRMHPTDMRPEHEMRLAHNRDAIAALRAPSAEEPWTVLVSGCLAGMMCGVEGTDYGLGELLVELFALDAIRTVPFCPEHHAIGTPRTMPDIHGGDGFDVLDGRARVLDERGADLTDAMLRGARAMVNVARASDVDFAILTDMSAACGSQVISDGCRLVEDRRYQRGVGVATAMLIRARIPVVSQRDNRTLEHLRARMDPTYSLDPEAVDHHERDWYRGYFGS